MEMKVADVIVKCLEAEGIEYAFGITGYHYLALYKALKNSSIKYISVKHENAASLSALQYARIAQKPALIMGTAGPGVTNLITGICELYKANLPCIIISPIVPTNVQGKNACQEDSGYGNSYSISSIMGAITKQSITCSNPATVAAHVRDLFRCSLEGRKGPVHLLVPVNLFDQTVDFSPVIPENYRNINNRNMDIEAIRHIAAELKKAEKPLLFVGHRAWYPNISTSLTDFSNTFGIPVVLSADAKGLFDEGSPLFGGILDLYGHRSAEVLVKQSDCIVSLGEEFGEFTVNKYEPGLFDGKLIQIDVDGYDIGRNYPVKASTCGDLGSILHYLKEEMKQLECRRYFNEDFRDFINNENASLRKELSDDSMPLKPQYILGELSACAPDNALFVTDIGRIGAFTFRNLKVKAGGYSLSLGNYTMAQAVAGSIGGKAAAPDKTVFIICGDGAFMMHGMEIATACQYKLPLIWLVFKDGFYGSVEWSQKLLYNDLDFCTNLFVPDLAKFASAFSIQYYQVTDSSSLRTAVKQAATDYAVGAKSALVEINFDNEEPLPMKPMLVKFIQDMFGHNEFKPTPYFMKSFKSMLREKV